MGLSVFINGLAGGLIRVVVVSGGWFLSKALAWLLVCSSVEFSRSFDEGFMLMLHLDNTTYYLLCLLIV